MPYPPAETDACRALLRLALQEDLGTAGDLTSLAVVPASMQGAAAFVARSPGVLAGLEAARLTFAAVDASVAFETRLEDGAKLSKGSGIATVRGPMRSILTAERTALNFLQRLSGVATQTARYAEMVAGLPVKLLDTRKTTPGWRLLEKHAVRMGGGANHRMGLHDGILVKDNHLAGLGVADRRSQIEEAVRRSRAAFPGVPVEVEVDTLEQLDAALAMRPEIVLLDNMGPDLLREAVRRRDAASPAVKLEASGGVTLDTLRAIAETGVDRVSVGALTHSAVALDIGLDYAS
ncbi:MAG: carboxylating nicotinate-nucleotide diphosphorylase [Gemmataceae bacterium]|nr:carboxylating nicotinate-nucleotide diphosphorylase [Gemmataceae bacterium]